jgi:hypothetical protein
MALTSQLLLALSCNRRLTLSILQIPDIGALEQNAAEGNATAEYHLGYSYSTGRTPTENDKPRLRALFLPVYRQYGSIAGTGVVISVLPTIRPLRRN